MKQPDSLLKDRVVEFAKFCHGSDIDLGKEIDADSDESLEKMLKDWGALKRIHSRLEALLNDYAQDLEKRPQ